jgi:endonuclease YncB( thermonuclease family)
MKPTPGLMLNVAFKRCRDGDTVEVSLPGSGWIWAIRLINVWAPELHTGEQRQQAAAGKCFLEDYLHSIDPPDLWLHVPVPQGSNLLKNLTFDRIPGVLYAGDVEINSLLVSKGYASSTKGGALGT